MPQTPLASTRSIAIVGAGMAGIACARTFGPGGSTGVTVFDKSSQVGGRMAPFQPAFGTFDHGALSISPCATRFAWPQTAPCLQAWSANSVRRVLGCMRPPACRRA